jgi:hypothetical protein
MSAPEELFMGHRFFKPFANNMVSLQEVSGLEAKSMELVFSGGQNGVPQAMWEDDPRIGSVTAVEDDSKQKGRKQQHSNHSGQLIICQKSSCFW